MKKLFFVYNPNAGKGLLKPKISDIVDVFVKAEYEVTIYPTQKKQDAYEKVRDLQGEYDLVICSGGDGTLDEVVTGMMNRDVKIPIGYIPTGTTNDFANSLGIPKKILQAADVAVNGREFPCDIGWFNEDNFVYIAAFGLFTDVSYQTRQEMKNVLGHLAYLLEGAKRLHDIPSYHIRVEHDGEVVEDEFIYGMVTNSRSVGGFRNMIGNHVVFDDGVFEVTMIPRPKTLLALQETISELLKPPVQAKHMYAFKTSKVTFETPVAIPWTLDGEYGGDHSKVVVRNDQQALKIRVEDAGSLSKWPEKFEKEKE